MMWDMGLGDGSPETHIGQLTNALLRNVRYPRPPSGCTRRG